MICLEGKRIFCSVAVVDAVVSVGAVVVVCVVVVVVTVYSKFVVCISFHFHGNVCDGFQLPRFCECVLQSTCVITRTTLF